MNTDVRALEQLIALRKHSLEELRKDLSTLDFLVRECSEKLNTAHANHDVFAEETRQAEVGLASLVAVQMMERRRYMAYLQQHIEQAEKTLGEATEQQRRAQKAFNDCFTEIRTLERVAERRKAALRQELQRKSYLVADDQEILRLGQNRSMYGAN